ncbi:MAG: helix-turn-helix domain-containing protein [Blastocatellia bacterium]
MESRILIEPGYAIERRAWERHSREAQPQPDFLVVYLAGAVMLINPHRPVPMTGRGEAIFVRLAPELLIEAATRLRLYQTGSQLLFRAESSWLEDERLQATLDAIAHEFAAEDAGWREVIRSSIHQLAVHLLRRHINVRRSDEVELSRVGIVDRRLRRAIEFMHDNCGRDLPLAEIAAAAWLSEFHFARLFKSITGATPHAYLAALRIEKARRLLAETDLPIHQIGADVGYASQSHFTRVFREATGMPPRAFRLAALRTVR